MEKISTRPRSRIKILGHKHRCCLSDLIDKNDEFIINSVDSIHFSYDDVKNNFDFLKHILELDCSKDISFSCNDYDSVLFLENNCSEKLSNRVSLIDDFHNKDRSYIKPDELEKFKLVVPLVYTTWNMDVKDSVFTNCFFYRNLLSDFVCCDSSNGNHSISKETLLMLKSKVLELKEVLNSNDLDKIISVSNYIQKSVQYVENIESHASDGLYILEDIPNSITEPLHNKTGYVESALKDGNGLCMAITNATTMLLNNPEFNVDIRSIMGEGHVWNIVKLNDKHYYIDNTWNITRNPNKIENALQASSFYDKYLLFGKNTLSTLTNHNSAAFNPHISSLSQEDYSREDILSSFDKIPTEDKIYPEKANYKSYKKTK